MKKLKLLLLLGLLLTTSSALAAGECKKCEWIYASEGTLVFCQNVLDNEVGHTQCVVTWTTIGNGGFVMCQTSGNFCSTMVVEVNP